DCALRTSVPAPSILIAGDDRGYCLRGRWYWLDGACPLLLKASKSGNSSSLLDSEDGESVAAGAACGVTADLLLEVDWGSEVVLNRGVRAEVSLGGDVIE